MNLPSSVIKKRLTSTLLHANVEFDLSTSLFSSHDIDTGSRALLNSLTKNHAITYSKILDIGCGHGIIGITLKKTNPNATVHLTDRDMVAIAFSDHNSTLNHVKTTAYASLDYQSITDKFSLIISNVPAKLQRAGLEIFIYGASHHLNPNGTFAFVVVNELRDDVESILTNPDIKRTYSEVRTSHTMYHIQFLNPIKHTPSYERSSMTLDLKGPTRLVTSIDLDEFNNLSYETIAALKLIGKIPSKTSLTIINPGQGHLAMACAISASPPQITLCSRDLLEIQTTKDNLETYYSDNIIEHPCAFLTKPPADDIIVWHLSDKNDRELYEQTAWQLIGKKVLAYGPRRLIKDTLPTLKGASEEFKTGLAIFGELKKV